TSYQEFAKVYDTVMDDSLYKQWLNFTQRHVSQSAHSLLELACGSGVLALELKKSGYDVRGIDLSEEMLTIASNRAMTEGQEIEFIAGDMRELDQLVEPEAFDVITCYSDSICYMQNIEQVKEVVDGVYTSLTVDGTFIFDVHSVNQVDKEFPGYSYHENEENFAFLWDSFAGEFPHSVVHELTFFVEDSEGTFIRKDEIHEERTYPIEEYLQVLSKFSNVKVYADFTDDEPNNESKRWFFVCQK
ncbi:MAG: class I SAM-dependent methyltransferase, partial [Streptococcaceae bacterium]|nr:class I SAM-dependent methyltransferase [Streptococcaceae bacterium]